MSTRSGYKPALISDAFGTDKLCDNLLERNEFKASSITCHF